MEMVSPAATDTEKVPEFEVAVPLTVTVARVAAPLTMTVRVLVSPVPGAVLNRATMAVRVIAAATGASRLVSVVFQEDWWLATMEL